MAGHRRRRPGNAAVDDVVAAAGVTLPVELAPVSGTVRGSRMWPLDEEWTVAGGSQRPFALRRVE